MKNRKTASGQKLKVNMTRGKMVANMTVIFLSHENLTKIASNKSVMTLINKTVEPKRKSNWEETNLGKGSKRC